MHKLYQITPHLPVAGHKSSPLLLNSGAKLMLIISVKRLSCWSELET